MNVTAVQTDLSSILLLRNLFLQENNFQIRYNAIHERGWSDSYMLMYNEEKIGYGTIRGNQQRIDRDTVFEFYIIPSFRNISSLAFSALLHASNASFIEGQSNDLLLTSLLYEYADNIHSEVILFEGHAKSSWSIDKIIFRRRNYNDVVFERRYVPSPQLSI